MASQKQSARIKITTGAKKAKKPKSPRKPKKKRQVGDSLKREHKILREMLCKMVKPTACDILSTYLPNQEYIAIYYADVEKENLNYIADIRLNCSESAVKKYRKRGYEKLSTLLFK